MDNRDRHESIIITTDQKDAIIASMLVFILIVAIKFLVIGFWLGRRNCC